VIHFPRQNWSSCRRLRLDNGRTERRKGYGDTTATDARILPSMAGLLLRGKSDARDIYGTGDLSAPLTASAAAPSVLHVHGRTIRSVSSTAKRRDYRCSELPIRGHGGP
jgi:hypothetical protein